RPPRTTDSFVGRFFCGMLGGAESMTPMARVMQPPCASPRVCLPAPQQAVAPPLFSRLAHLIIYSSYRFTYTFFGVWVGRFVLFRTFVASDYKQKHPIYEEIVDSGDGVRRMWLQWQQVCKPSL
ncbi:MAG: hypothetical protein IIV28_05910, partial [Alistipes sp.]|nr:hypothetical protein [Alistipes sp.]